jgi:hypothetical protein
MEGTVTVTGDVSRLRSRRPALRLLAAAAALVAATAIPAVAASAQTAPTVPCEGCGGGPPGDGTRVWSHTEFVCDPSRAFIAVFGVGRNVTEPVNFSAGIARAGSGTVTVSPVAQGVQPGESRQVLLPAPDENMVVDVRIVGVGARTGRVLLDNTRELECICSQPTTTTTPVAPTTVPGQVTTVPEQATTTTTPAIATSVNRVTTVPGTLPETGGSGGSMAVSGALLVVLGLGALVAGAFVRRAPADES